MENSKKCFFFFFGITDEVSFSMKFRIFNDIQNINEQTDRTILILKIKQI